MFLGRHTTLFSGKNRIILPKKFRAELGVTTHFYVVAGRDGELWGFRAREWEMEVEKRLAMPLTDSKARKERRDFFGQAEECVLDSQGRFIISQNLVEASGLEGDIVLIGCGDHFEIWNKGRFEKYLKKESDIYD